MEPPIRPIEYNLLGYELYYGISLAMFGRLTAEKGSCKQTDRNNENLYMDKRPDATGWLQTICFNNFFIRKGKVSNFSCIFQHAAIR